MRVLVLGGTGNIGSAIVDALRGRGADVSILCRNKRSVEKAEALNSSPLLGDIEAPAQWVKNLLDFDAVIHTACTFDETMSAVDSKLTSALLEALSNCKPKKTLIYTGGGWLYGDTPPDGANESTPFEPTLEFSWMVENSRRVVNCGGLNGITIHPANVVDKRKLGVPPILIEENAHTSIIRIPASVETTWPLVEREDLAQLFCLALDRGKARQDYIGASIESIALGALATIVSNHFGIHSEPVCEPIESWMGKYGNWARGYSLNQVLRAEKAKAELDWLPGFTL